MVLKYAPCDITHLSDLLTLCWDITDTTCPNDQKQILIDLIDDNFCKHFIKKGCNNGKLCLTKHTNNNLYYCKKHIPKKLIKCLGTNKYNKPCGRNVKKEGLLCKYCIKKNVYVYNCKIDKPIYYVERNYDGSYNDNSGSLIKNFDIEKYYINNYNYFLNAIYNFFTKYNINIEVLVFTLNLISKSSEMENKNLFHQEGLDNMQLNTYDKSYNKYKKNLKNRKKMNKKMKLIEKKKNDVKFAYKNVNVKTLNNDDLIINVDCGNIDIKLWPLNNYEMYKDFTPSKIIYFHNYYNIEKEDTKKVILFYKMENKFNFKKITYKELYDLLIKEYSSGSVYEFIKYYYKNFNLCIKH